MIIALSDTTAGLLTSLITLITVVFTAFLNGKTKSQVTEVHALVNKAADTQSEKIETQSNRIEQLTGAIQSTGATVPPKPVSESGK